MVGSTISKISIIDERFSATLLKHFFKRNFERIQANNTGAAIPHSNKSFINSMLFKIPSCGILNKWNNLIDPTYKQIQTLKDQTHRLKESRDILLPRLMSGTINVMVPETRQPSKIIQLEAPIQKQAVPQFKEAIYVVGHKNGQLTGFIAGPNIEKAMPYFESYCDIEYLTWLETQFKYKSNDDLELFATVDNSLIELNKKNAPFTIEAVKNILKNEPEWTAKLEREIFSDPNILRAVTYLPTIFQY